MCPYPFTMIRIWHKVSLINSWFEFRIFINYLPYHAKKKTVGATIYFIGFIFFLGHFREVKSQTASSKIWTRVTGFIFDDETSYAKPILLYMLLHCLKWNQLALLLIFWVQFLK